MNDYHIIFMSSIDPDVINVTTPIVGFMPRPCFPFYRSTFSHDHYPRSNAVPPYHFIFTIVVLVSSSLIVYCTESLGMYLLYTGKQCLVSAANGLYEPTYWILVLYVQMYCMSCMNVSRAKRYCRDKS